MQKEKPKSLKEFLIEVEGFMRTVYKDSAGLDTIGIGHLITKAEKENGLLIEGRYVDPYKGLTDKQVEQLFYCDIAVYRNAVLNAVKVKLNENQKTALISFCFNVGINNFIRSTLLKKINERKFEDVPNELRRWIYAGGKKNKGLINRRELEIKMWNGKY